jgi:hypothetical protein
VVCFAMLRSGLWSRVEKYCGAALCVDSAVSRYVDLRRKWTRSAVRPLAHGFLLSGLAQPYILILEGITGYGPWAWLPFLIKQSMRRTVPHSPKKRE